MGKEHLKKDPKIKILVACHKADPNIREDDIYMPIHVGKALHPELDLGFQGDNTGDNISEKNPYYCELTALYWAWKNLKDVDYIGLCHYRRFFDFKSKKTADKDISPEPINNIQEIQIDYSKLNYGNVILPKMAIYSIPIWKEFSEFILREDFYILEKVMNKYYPEYYSTFEKYMTGNKRTMCNMFLMSWKNFDKYCNFLFGILSEVEKNIKLSPYKNYQRIFGYLGELLLPVFCIHHNIKIKEKRKIFIAQGELHNIPEYKYKISRLISNLIFKINKRFFPTSLKNDFWENNLIIDNIKI